MIETDLLSRINTTFGKYQRPNKISGYEREDWMDRIESLPLDEVVEDDLAQALRHIFPTHYGDIDVFRYLLPRCLYLSFWTLEIQVHDLTEEDFDSRKEYEDYLDVKDDMLEDYKTHRIESTCFHSEVRELTPQRCIVWREYFTDNERHLLNEIFWWAFQQEYDRTHAISPFYFNVLFRWSKQIPDCYRLGNDIEPALTDYKNKVKQLMLPHIENPQKSPTEACLGVYCLIEDDVPHWDDVFDEDMFMSPSLIYAQIETLLSKEELKVLRKFQSEAQHLWKVKKAGIYTLAREKSFGQTGKLGQQGGNLAFWGPERFFSVVRSYSLSCYDRCASS